MTFDLTASSSQTIKRNILIVDDHPFIIEGYKNAITRYNPKEYDFVISQAYDCRSAYDLLEDEATPNFDIAFLDISMPAYEEKELYSGEDLAKLIMKKMPYCKIILLTMYTELLKIKTIIRTIQPNGLIIKNDLTFDELLFAFDKVIKNEKYYSQSVVKMLNQSPHNSIEIDQFDKQILFHLSKGTKVEEMSQYIPISLNAIEKRRINLKELLKIKSGSDEELVKEAKSKGLF
ncbi:response regulator transcription factor [Flavobacterium sp. JLP]|uniref:response regulator n=1 Tax=unclassified Flavobacterium TaxID=196869 RepID=UPI000493112F|nr:MULTISPECIES: response regulator [unclassified Flavobacterium]MBF4493620.1 response regulator transcription factor [Flavobacterium sp. MR2016-29]MBF4508134.1 response regulator transcription factor [Flavobacterium sp. JLP]